MKASDLKPGQFFEFEPTKERRLCIDQLDDGRCMFVARRARNPDRQIILVIDSCCQSLDVTPLNVHGWDDEPSDKANEDFIAERFVDIAIKSQKKLDALTAEGAESGFGYHKGYRDAMVRAAGLLSGWDSWIHARMRKANEPEIGDDEPEGEPRCEVCRQPADGKTLDDVPPDALCDCTCATKCPLGKIGTEARCTREELDAHKPAPLPVAHFRRATPAEVEQYCKEKELTTLHPLEAERNAFRKHYAAQSPVDEDNTNGMPREPQLKGPSEAWLREMAEKEDGKCISVGGLAVELGLYKHPVRFKNGNWYWGDWGEWLLEHRAYAIQRGDYYLQSNSDNGSGFTSHIRQVWTPSQMPAIDATLLKNCKPVLIAEPQPDPDGWIAHDGKGCPVNHGAKVQVKRRRMKTIGEFVVQNGSHRYGSDWFWLPNRTDRADIVAYRLVQ